MDSSYSNYPASIKIAFQKYDEKVETMFSKAHPSSIVDISRTMSDANASSPSMKKKQTLSGSFSRRKHIVAFTQPINRPNFVGKLKKNFVSLENVGIPDDIITGSIQTIPIEPYVDNEVTIRITTDDWKTYQDYPAVKLEHASPHELMYKSSFDPPLFQAYSFEIKIPTYSQKLMFAIKYKSSNTEFWDSNDGKNYCII